VKPPAFQLYAAKYPNCSVFFDAENFYMSTLNLSCKEIGNLIKSIIKESIDGNFEYLKPLPFITSFNKGWKKRKPIPSSVKRAVLAVGNCVLCASIENLTIDHIVPLSKGGSDNIENLQCLCSHCNRKKGPERNG
jgi:hypothetical protein